MSIATLLQAAEYLERRERGECLVQEVTTKLSLLGQLRLSCESNMAAEQLMSI